MPEINPHGLPDFAVLQAVTIWYRDTPMTRLLAFLSQTSVLCGTFFLTVFLTLLFLLGMWAWDFELIDEMFRREQIEAHLSALSPKQRSAHAWITGTVDVVYPFAYAGFFAGMAARAFGRYGAWLAAPSLLVVPADLIEGVSQIMLMKGQTAFIEVKLVATPTKLVLFGLGAVFTVVAALVLLWKTLVKAEP